MATSIIRREQEIKLGTISQSNSQTSSTGNIDTGLTSPIRILCAWNYYTTDYIIIPWKGYNQRWYLHVMKTDGTTASNVTAGTIAYQYLDTQ